MKLTKLTAVVLGFALALALPVLVRGTDVWDASGADGNSGTDNELTHGTEQVHDLQSAGGVADQDWYLVAQQPYASYEVVVDGLTEELASIPVSEADDAIGVDLVDSGGTILTGSGGTAIGAARSLVFRNATGALISGNYVRVRSAVDGCTTTCTANAQYRIRFRDTTLLAPRFNNSGTQTTVLILQNGGPASASVTARYWSSAGALLGNSSATIPARGATVIATSGVVPSLSGSITIDHTGRFGDITGKAVAIEPATGFTFDTPVVSKPY
jgi:hypothetical protein